MASSKLLLEQKAGFEAVPENQFREPQLEYNLGSVNPALGVVWLLNKISCSLLERALQLFKFLADSRSME